MGIHAAIDVDHLSGNIVAFVGSKVHAGVSDVFGAAIAINFNVAQEDIAQRLGNNCFILWRNNKARTNAIAANIFLAVLQCNTGSKHVNSCLSACISGCTKVATAGSHGANVNDRTALFGNFCNQSLAAFFASTANYHVRSFCGEGLSDAASNTAGRSCYDGNFVLQTIHNESFLLWQLW